MKRHTDTSSPVGTHEFSYRPAEYEAWVSAHGRWWPDCKNPSVWGRFAPQAACGRYTFSGRNQKEAHFAETLVASELERDGYVCWTRVLILRKPKSAQRDPRMVQTFLVEALLHATGCKVPQEEYEKRYRSEGLRLKRVDVVGFHFGRNHWVFSEVKKEHDRLHPEQRAALSFLRSLFPKDRADVFLASVRARTEG